MLEERVRGRGVGGRLQESVRCREVGRGIGGKCKELASAGRR